jgi:DNA-directed RNA polymerase subunit RPC12/RpoP
MANDKSGDDIDVKTYATFSCVDCGREFQTHEELEDHASTH